LNEKRLASQIENNSEMEQQHILNRT